MNRAPVEEHASEYLPSRIAEHKRAVSVHELLQVKVTDMDHRRGGVYR